MNKLEAIQAIKEGKKVRREIPAYPDIGGYIFSYDGVMASVVTNEGKTIKDFKMIDKLVLPEGDFYNVVESVNFSIEDFIGMHLK